MIDETVTVTTENFDVDGNLIVDGGNTDGNTDGSTDGNTDGNTDGSTDGNTDGNVDGGESTTAVTAVTTINEDGSSVKATTTTVTDADGNVTSEETVFEYFDA